MPIINLSRYQYLWRKEKQLNLGSLTIIRVVLCICPEVVRINGTRRLGAECSIRSVIVGYCLVIPGGCSDPPGLNAAVCIGRSFHLARWP